MIKFLDNVTLQYTNEQGILATVGPMDWDRYALISANQSAQHQCEVENTQAQSSYFTKLHDYDNADQGSRGAPPAKPLMKIVSDMNVVTFAPFSPPLPDAKPALRVNPDNHSVIPNTGLAAGTATTGDPQFAALIKILLALSAKVDALAALVTPKA